MHAYYYWKRKLFLCCRSYRVSFDIVYYGDLSINIVPWEIGRYTHIGTWCGTYLFTHSLNNRYIIKTAAHHGRGAPGGCRAGEEAKKKIDKQTIPSWQAYEWSWPERMNVTHEIDKKDERRRRQSRTYMCICVRMFVCVWRGIEKKGYGLQPVRSCCLTCM